MRDKWYWIAIMTFLVSSIITILISEYFKGQKIDHCIQLQIQYEKATPESLLKCKEVYK